MTITPNIRYILDKLTFTDEHAAVPEYLRDSLINYVVAGVPTGGFLEAVLSNDLKGAINRGDIASQRALVPLVRWLYNRAPNGCWGSPESYETWVAGYGLRRFESSNAAHSAEEK